MFEIQLQKWPFSPLWKAFPFLFDVRPESYVLWLVCPFFHSATPLTITLKRFVPDQKRRNRKKRDSYHCDAAYDISSFPGSLFFPSPGERQKRDPGNEFVSDSTYDCNFRSTQNFNAPYDYGLRLKLRFQRKCEQRLMIIACFYLTGR